MRASSRARGALSVAGQVRRVPADVRPIVQRARGVIKAIAPGATEVAYQSDPPRSKSAMWKLVRYGVAGEYVVALGAFPTYATLFFYRGRELDDGSGLLEGGGKDLRFVRLRSPADVERRDITRVLRRAFALVSSSA